VTAIDLDRIHDRAARVDVRRALLTAVASVPFAVGWLLGKTLMLVLLAFAAGRVGFEESRGKKGPR
jgi:hypothetical protein